MQIYIPAEGLGSRLTHLTEITPKPLIPVVGKPILEHQIEFFKKYGVTSFIISVVYLKEQIKSYFADGSKWGVAISYCEPAKLLGNAGALLQIPDQLENEFIVCYCDYFLQFDLEKFIHFHSQQQEALATVVTQKFPWPSEVDHVLTDNAHQITKFITRPHPPGSKIKNQASTGIYICKKELLKCALPNKEEQSFEKDLFPNALAANKKIYAYHTDEFIEDMGSHIRLEKVENDIKSGKHLLKQRAHYPDYAYT